MRETNEENSDAAASARGVMRRVASLGGVGDFGTAPGTAASVVCWVPWFVVGLGGWEFLLIVVVAVSVLGFWVCRSLERAGYFKTDMDPSWVVIDEAAGLGVAFIPFAAGGGVAAAVLALIFFRLFDIYKPFPVARAERLGGSRGIMLDDLVAGLMAAAAVWFVLLLASALL
ncbi:MAG: phosphatidylglycerophosphatase A [Alphaproteobacteria bacterium]|nr:phosphatidylglycerophosphatase A [Alphaproteobacteria bacterium]MDA7983210.1 phosphatidylglycerophosphatase A [Alphaproteobacteria bacterium]MDA8008827.1 phosphatidylglycerophosphatase A [Alphaproteobacteria bacterium]